MGVAGLSLDSVGDVEHHPGALACQDAWHEFFEVVDEILPLEEVEARYLKWAVARFGGDKASLARKLGLGQRTFYRKLKRDRRESTVGT